MQTLCKLYAKFCANKLHKLSYKFQFTETLHNLVESVLAPTALGTHEEVRTHQVPSVEDYTVLLNFSFHV